MTEPDENLVVVGDELHWLLPSQSTAYVEVKTPMPCITILVHGVNDVGEAFPNQEKGLCAGLNKRLFRKDLACPDWTVPPPPKDGKKFTAEEVSADPDKVYYQRPPDKATSSIIPFYWGFREITSLAKTTATHGQYLDRFGNRIDKRYGKNGGPFANATTNIPDMFGPGFNRNWGVRRADPESGTHPLLSAPPRTYMVLAAQRLAALIRVIRKKSPNEPINVVAHSQGCFVTLLAHAMLAKEGKNMKADVFIMNNPPYSVDEPLLEQVQTGNEQQTSYAREETLRQIIAEYITKGPAVVPAFADLKKLGSTGADWAPNANKERDNRGKVYLYFSPDDATVGLPNIQGIGWWGVYDGMREKLGSRFFQRMFASPDGKNADAAKVGEDPKEYTISFKWNSGFTFRRHRLINAEALPQPFVPDLGAARLMNGPIDAAIAVANPYKKKGEEGVLPTDKTPEEAQARWLNKDDANSHHSSIVSSIEHSQKATAYDLCVGVSGILKNNDVTWISFLRAAADWRTNWRGTVTDITSNNKDASFPPPSQGVVGVLDKNIDAEERDIFLGNCKYYCPSGEAGLLPGFTRACTVASLNPYVTSQTVDQVIEEQNEYRTQSRH
ncbi:alpha/beta hydrolase family protein DUF900 [Collimonas sp. PA-H2]|uniref:T6SS effector phospholipase Tle3 domain-containing protein n=1 Tax=Collimonas sp. PA-H2 TaxID=1881062 RepID=UPI000C017AD2|nr:DUF3274 domain-containing protein [Collimonas sp. PA-H2]PFH07867.1 alpha/beta hydrolase family protein DUF900 [Collimonas sp. PA-H2]